MMQELLNIEQFCQRKFNEFKTNASEEIGTRSWY